MRCRVEPFSRLERFGPPVILSPLANGDFEVTLTDVEFRILHEAVKRMIETADWEFQTLMGVYVEEAVPVLERLERLSEDISSGSMVVRLSDHELFVCRQSMVTLLGAFGQESLLADRADVDRTDVMRFSVDFFRASKS